MKRLLAIFLLVTLLPLSGAFCYAEEIDTSVWLYTARTRVAGRLYADWEGTEGFNQTDTVPARVRVKVHALNPTFAYISYEPGNMAGYVRRTESCICPSCCWLPLYSS